MSGPETEPLLRLSHLQVDLRVRGGMRRVIHDVSATVAAGEALGLVGESGSGKTITVRSIVRLLPYGARITGDIVFDGQRVNDYSPSELRQLRAFEVKTIYQDSRAAINPVRTVGDFVTEGLVHIMRMPQKAADEAAVTQLEAVGIADAARRLRQYPHQLSGGLLQRVMIAHTLLAHPRLLLADEPSTSLDVTTQEEVMYILDQQRREHGLTMIFVSHDLDLAEAVTDRIAVMYAGVIVEVAPSGDMHETALHPYTAALLAARPGTAKVERLAVIPGRPVSAWETGAGCVFYDRCSFAEQHCQAVRPEPRPIEDHMVACHRVEELRQQKAFSRVRSA